MAVRTESFIFKPVKQARLARYSWARGKWGTTPLLECSNDPTKIDRPQKTHKREIEFRF